MENQNLIDELKVLLATTFTFYMKAHNYHVNVVDEDFVQLHEFFGDMYEDLHSSVDVIAELIRAEDSFSPFCYSRFTELSLIEDTPILPTTAAEMVGNLRSCNTVLMACLVKARKEAELIENFGVTNALEDLITKAQKRAWMLRSITK